MFNEMRIEGDSSRILAETVFAALPPSAGKERESFLDTYLGSILKLSNVRL